MTGTARAERVTLAGVPAVLETPTGEPRGTIVVYHGATNSKAGAFEQYAGVLAEHGFTVAYPDAALHGDLTPDGGADAFIRQRGYRDYVWEAVRGTTAAAPAFITALLERAPAPLGVIGTSMGGYAAHWLLANDARVTAAVTISTHAAWHDPNVRDARLAAWLDRERPLDRAAHYPPRPVLVMHGDSDDTVPTRLGVETHAVLERAYAEANAAARLALHLAPGVAHATTPDMRRRAVAWLRAHLTQAREERR